MSSHASHSEAMVTERSSSHSLSDRPESPRTVLVVDDEPLVRELMNDLLQTCGFQVVCASGGLEAIGLYRQQFEAGRPFDLVILDLSMPSMGGEECLAQLLSLDPGAKVLLASGLYERTSRAADVQGAQGLLCKPFKFDSLLQTIRRIIGE